MLKLNVLGLIYRHFALNTPLVHKLTMFEAKLQTSSLFKKLVEGVKDLITDADLDFSESGIGLQAMDNSHVALVAFSLHGPGFDLLSCDSPFSSGVNLASLSTVLRCAEDNAIITLKADKDGDALELIFDDVDNDQVSEFKLTLMHIDNERLEIPETEYDAVVSMSSAEFSRICKRLQHFSDSIQIDVTPGSIKFSAQGEVGSVSIVLKLPKDADNETPIQQKNVSQSFSLKYLISFTKATSLSNQVTLSMVHGGGPIMLEYMAEAGYIRYFLAPQIANDD